MNLDFSTVSKNNVDEFLKSGQLKIIYLIATRFGGSEGVENQVVVTPKAYEENEKIDNELHMFLSQNKSVENFYVDLEYKDSSIVPSKVIVTAIVDRKDYKRIIEVW